MRMSFLASLLAGFLGLFGHLHSTPDSYTRMVDRVSGSMVRITGEKAIMTMFGPMQAQYVCTGEVIAQDRVLTAAHCLGDKMTSDGIGVDKVLAHDEYYDLALLKVQTGSKPVVLFRHTDVKRFEALTAIGYGYGLTHLTVLSTHAFLIDISVWENEDGRPGAPGLITQGGYIGGMSGGVVVDADGLVVSIVQQSNQGVGYGVGIKLVDAFLTGVE